MSQTRRTSERDSWDERDRSERTPYGRPPTAQRRDQQRDYDDRHHDRGYQRHDDHGRHSYDYNDRGAYYQPPYDDRHGHRDDRSRQEADWSRDHHEGRYRQPASQYYRPPPSLPARNPDRYAPPPPARNPARDPARNINADWNEARARNQAQQQHHQQGPVASSSAAAPSHPPAPGPDPPTMPKITRKQKREIRESVRAPVIAEMRDRNSLLDRENVSLKGKLAEMTAKLAEVTAELAVLQVARPSELAQTQAQHKNARAQLADLFDERLRSLAEVREGRLRRLATSALNKPQHAELAQRFLDELDTVYREDLLENLGVGFSETGELQMFGDSEHEGSSDEGGDDDDEEAEDDGNNDERVSETPLTLRQATPHQADDDDAGSSYDPAAATPSPPPKRGRGRPRKTPVVEIDNTAFMRRQMGGEQSKSARLEHAAKVFVRQQSEHDKAAVSKDKWSEKCDFDYIYITARMSTNTRLRNDQNAAAKMILAFMFKTHYKESFEEWHARAAKRNMPEPPFKHISLPSTKPTTAVMTIRKVYSALQAVQPGSKVLIIPRGFDGCSCDLPGWERLAETLKDNAVEVSLAFYLDLKGYGGLVKPHPLSDLTSPPEGDSIMQHINARFTDICEARITITGITWEDPDYKEVRSYYNDQMSNRRNAIRTADPKGQQKPLAKK